MLQRKARIVLCAQHHHRCSRLYMILLIVWLFFYGKGKSGNSIFAERVSKNWTRVTGLPQAPRAQCEESQRKYKSLYSNPTIDLGRQLYKKNSQLKITLLLLCRASFLFFFRFDAIWAVFNSSVVNSVMKSQGCTLNSQELTKLSQIFLDKMFPRLQFHIGINWQRLNFHFNPTTK